MVRMLIAVTLPVLGSTTAWAVAPVPPPPVIVTVGGTRKPEPPLVTLIALTVLLASTAVAVAWMKPDGVVTASCAAGAAATVKLFDVAVGRPMPLAWRL